MLVSHSLRHSDIVSILTLLPWYPRAADWAIAEMTPKQRGRKDATSYKKMRRHPTSKCCSQISPTTQHSTNDWLLVLGQASHETVNFSPSRGVQWPSDKHVVSLGNPECCFWFDKKVIIIIIILIIIIIIITVIIVTSFTKTEQTIPQWKKLKSFSWSHAIFANPRISLHRNTNITRFFCWDSLGFPYHLAPTNGVNVVVFSLSSNAHRLVWIASLPVPQGTEMCQSTTKFWISEGGFRFGNGRYLRLLENILRYLKLLETSDIFLQISSQSHHREVLDFTIHNSCHESSQFPRGSFETRSTGYSEISQFRKTINPILI